MAATDQLKAQSAFTLAQLEALLEVKKERVHCEEGPRFLEDLALNYGVIEFFDATPSAYQISPAFDPIRELSRIAGADLPTSYTAMRALDTQLVASQEYEAWDCFRADLLERVDLGAADALMSPYVEKIHSPTLAVQRLVDMVREDLHRSATIEDVGFEP